MGVCNKYDVRKLTVK